MVLSGTMAVGKSTLIEKIKDEDILKSIDVHGEDANNLLKNWYRGKYHPFVWESLCVRWYMDKETNALFNIIEDPSKKGIVFDRSSVDCMNFCVALCVSKFYVLEQAQSTDLSQSFSLFASCFAMISSSVGFMRRLNVGKMVYVELTNKYSLHNLTKRNRSAEKYHETDEWNPSFIFCDEDAYELFSSVYGYTSLVVGNLFREQYDDLVVGTNSSDNISKQTFKFLKKSENIALDLYKTPIKLSDEVDFQLDSSVNELTNLFKFITLLYNQSVLVKLKPFYKHEIFDGKICGDSDYISDWLTKENFLYCS